jgi:hypothetical protein
MELIELERQLGTAVGDVCASVGRSPSGLHTTLSENDISALRLCFVIEAVLSHGLQDLHFFSKTSYWELFSFLPDCLPNTSHILQSVKKLAKTGFKYLSSHIHNRCASSHYFSLLLITLQTQVELESLCNMLSIKDYYLISSPHL